MMTKLKLEEKMYRSKTHISQALNSLEPVEGSIKVFPRVLKTVLRKYMQTRPDDFSNRFTGTSYGMFLTKGGSHATFRYLPTAKEITQLGRFKFIGLHANNSQIILANLRMEKGRPRRIVILVQSNVRLIQDYGGRPGYVGRPWYIWDPERTGQMVVKGQIMQVISPAAIPETPKTPVLPAECHNIEQSSPDVSIKTTRGQMLDSRNDTIASRLPLRRGLPTFPLQPGSTWYANWEPDDDDYPIDRLNSALLDADSVPLIDGNEIQEIEIEPKDESPVVHQRQASDLLHNRLPEQTHQIPISAYFSLQKVDDDVEEQSLPITADSLSIRQSTHLELSPQIDPIQIPTLTWTPSPNTTIDIKEEVESPPIITINEPSFNHVFYEFMEGDNVVEKNIPFKDCDSPEKLFNTAFELGIMQRKSRMFLVQVGRYEFTPMQAETERSFDRAVMMPLERLLRELEADGDGVDEKITIVVRKHHEYD